MSLVLPILFISVLVGLNAHRMTPRAWGVIAAGTIFVILFHLFKS